MAAPVRCGRRLLLALVLLNILGSVLVSSHDHQHGHAHDHDHDHGDDDGKPAHFKYSQQANEADLMPDVAEEELDYAGHDDHDHDNHGHGHSHDAHDHGHDAHGHSHDAHGHSHDAHDHGHDAHGHSHDAHDHGHDAHGHSHDHHEQDAHHGHSHGEQETPKREKRGMLVPLAIWLQALGSTALVSIAPVFILLLIPIDNSKEHKSLLKVLLSFASGGLLGDAFLHLIPHALSPHSHGGEEEGHGHSHDAAAEEDAHGHSHGKGMSVGLWVLAGIIVFLAVEKFVRIVKGEDGHGHSHGPAVKKSKAKKSDDESDAKTSDESETKKSDESEAKKSDESETKKSDESEAKKSDSEEKKTETEGGKKDSKLTKTVEKTKTDSPVEEEGRH